MTCHSNFVYDWRGVLECVLVGVVQEWVPALTPCWSGGGGGGGAGGEVPDDVPQGVGAVVAC